MIRETNVPTLPENEDTVEFTARLWLRTALAAWVFWLGTFAYAVLAGAGR